MPTISRTWHSRSAKRSRIARNTTSRSGITGVATQFAESRTGTASKSMSLIRCGRFGALPKAFFEQRRGWGYDAPDPIFIVGLPRAGSTLLEQILSSHSQIEGTAELMDIITIARGLGNKSPENPAGKYPEILADLTEKEVREFGESYLETTRIQRTTDRPFFVDKMPNNFQHVGLIHLILPNSKIIDARRHPMGGCFSGFKQLFARGQTFTYGLEEIGKYYRDYVRVMDHWDEVLPGRVHRVQYEEMVADTENQIRALLEYCGLEFEEQCLRFYETERSIRTPSAEQVRKPNLQGRPGAMAAFRGPSRTPQRSPGTGYPAPVFNRTLAVDMPKSLQRAMHHLQSRRPAETFQICSAILAEHPGTIQAHYLRGCAAFEIGEIERSVSDLEIVHDNHPEHLHAAYYLGRALRAAGNLEAALPPLRAALAADDLVVRAHYDLAVCLAGLRRRTEAIEHYEAILALQPGNSQVAANMASLLERENRLDDAAAWTDKALSTDPGNEVAQMTRATLDRRNGEYMQAAKTFRRLILSTPNPVNRSIAWNQLGQCLEGQQKWGEAFDAFRESNQILRTHHKDADPDPRGAAQSGDAATHRRVAAR